MIDGTKEFSPMKTTFKETQLGDFHCILKIKSFKKILTKIITVRKTVKLCILKSIANLEALKSESGVKKNCYKHKRKTIEVIKWFWSDFWPRARPPPTQVLAYLRSRYPKTEPFFKKSPMFASLFLKDQKRYRQTGFTNVYYFHRKA